jgi:hypothetical protein
MQALKKAEESTGRKKKESAVNLCLFQTRSQVTAGLVLVPIRLALSVVKGT